MMNSFTTRLPRNLYRACDVQRLDQIAIEDYGMDSYGLMQNAGAVTLSALLEHWPQTRHLLIFVGSGNNAGDGYVIAGLAQAQAIHVQLIQMTPAADLKGDAAKAAAWASQQQVPMLSLESFEQRPRIDDELAAPHTVIVDALLGTGLQRQVSGAFARAIALINASELPVVAVDIPSGLSADTGNPLGSAVIANLTVTFIGMKQGLLTAQGRDYAGIILFSDLDIPDKVYQSASAPAVSAQRIDINDATRHLMPRARSSHKGQHGHVVVMGGDNGYGGAVLLAAEAALRAGAGLVSVICRSVHRPAILSRCPELMVLGTEDEGVVLDELVRRADVIAIGPGLGQNAWSRSLLQLALASQVAHLKPLIVDADALRLIAEKVPGTTGTKRDNWILTPHPGEASILLDSSVDQIQQDRFAAISALQQRWGGICLLKGSGSLICVREQGAQKLYLSSEGNAGMASAGMGDVLSGICASLVAQGLTLGQSLRCAVVIHGEAADLAVEHGGQRGMLASDLFPYIRQLVNPSL